MARLGCMVVAAVVLATAQLFQVAIVAEAAKKKKAKEPEVEVEDEDRKDENQPKETVEDVSEAATKPKVTETAASSPKLLKEMVAAIQSGGYANNFFDGELLVDTAETDAESVGACFLDKMVAVVEENAVKEFGNDFRLDVAGCCTKDTENCIQDLNEAWTTLIKVHLYVKKEDENFDKESAQIAFSLLQAIRKRVKEERVLEGKRHYFKKCMKKKKCTLDMLQTGVDIKDHRHELLQKSYQKGQGGGQQDGPVRGPPQGEPPQGGQKEEL